ncbi:MAG: dihydroorotate dehydrogenase electron transfer subunit [Bacteroidales bacterium]|nr:dihydroorotate dehydrogenase electron transfer subunit [Bacteroidales bacterium]
MLGKGTEMLADYNSGDKIDFLGPLGNGFSIPERLDYAILIAGGLGVAPLLFLSQELSSQKIATTLFCGNRTKETFVCTKEFDELGVNHFFATDDGSSGFKGTVTELFQKEINNFKNSAAQIYACGPNPMLQKIKQIAQQYNMECQMSLETKMACGFGTCMGCNVNSTSPTELFKYVCKDGPVFNSKEIELSD